MSSEARSKRLVLVVHGIGEQRSGETIDRLVGAATGNRASRVQSETRHLRDKHDGEDCRSRDLFECKIRKVDTEKSELVFAEVFWADLSRGRSGYLATLYELINGILGLGHLVRENAEDRHPEPEGHWMRSLANLIVAALHGPVAVINLMLVAGLSLIYLASQFLDAGWSVHAGTGATAALSAAAGSYCRTHTKSYLFKIFANWLFWLGIAVAGLVAATLLWNRDGSLPFSIPGVSCSGQGCQLAWYSLALIGPLNAVWLFLLPSSLILLAVSSIAETPKHPNGTKSIYAVICAIMLVFWLVVASAFWSSLSALLGKLPGEQDVKQGLLQLGISLITPVLIAFLIIVLVSAAVWFRRVRWAGKHNTQTYRSAPLPRLILNTRVQLSFIFAIVLLGAAAAVSTYVFFFASNELSRQISEIISQSFSYALVAAAAIAAVYSLAWSQLAAGLGIAKDIITYFKGEPVTGNATRQAYPLRARMHGRFATVMETMIASERPEEVIIVAHSQGTVVAIEAIRGNNTSLLFDRNHIKRRVLVTMGSPYSHIYEHYFGSKFTLPTDFSIRLDRWINIFRIDDFVGTIVGPEDGDWPVNIAVNPKGHTGYWTDGEVLDHLTKDVFAELV